MATDGERRYDDDEVAEILQRAADAEVRARPERRDPDGLSLTELQAIGAEAGLSPDMIARAASALDRVEPQPRRSEIYGLPVGVANAFPLPRPLSQEEWERMVTSFRHTFRARGRTSSDGDLHEWRNGNLQAVIEPAAEGWVLRFSTRKSEAAALALMAPVLIVALVVAAILGFLGTVDGLLLPGIIAAVAAVRIGKGVLTLPSWAEERERQFEALGAQAMRLAATPIEDEVR